MGLASSSLGHKDKAKEYLTKSLEILKKSVERTDDAEKVKMDILNLVWFI